MCEAYVVTLLCLDMPRLVVRKGHSKGMCLDEIGLCAQSMDFSLGHMLIYSVEPMWSLNKEDNFVL